MRFFARGINVAIGTDGPGSNADMDLPAAIRQTVMLQKHEQRNPEAVPGDLALRMATQNGARAIGFDQPDVIAPGHGAELIWIDTDRPHAWPSYNPISHLPHCPTASE